MSVLWRGKYTKLKRKLSQHAMIYPSREMSIVMVRPLVKGIRQTLNMFLSQNGASSTLNSVTIVEGKLKLDFKRNSILVGSYNLVYTGI